MKVLVLLLLVQQVSFVSILHGFEAVMELELVKNIVDVILDCLEFNREPFGNLLVGQPVSNPSNNFQFARRQLDRTLRYARHAFSGQLRDAREERRRHAG